MNLWQKFIMIFTPFQSVAEYEGAKQIHLAEMKVYRRQTQFVVGALSYGVPMVYLAFSLDGVIPRVLLFLIIFGELCIRDTVSEHYSLKLFRMQAE